MAARRSRRSPAKKRKPQRATPRAIGRLIIIGGHEDKDGDRSILREVAKDVGPGPLIVTTVASHAKVDDLWGDYERVFRDLGVKELRHLKLGTRREAFSEESVKLLHDARGVFFTGGDQLRITEQLGGTPLCDALRDMLARGGVVVGTSAGASVMAATMLIAGEGSASPRIGDTTQLGPGLGLMANAIIDQHFAQRGRIGRLLGAIALNPAQLGIGIDEDTAIVVEGGTNLRVIGRGAVYIVDGRPITQTNLDEADDGHALSIFNVKLHMLSSGDRFDLVKRMPAFSSGD